MLRKSVYKRKAFQGKTIIENSEFGKEYESGQKVVQIITKKKKKETYMILTVIKPYIYFFQYYN